MPVCSGGAKSLFRPLLMAVGSSGGGIYTAFDGAVTQSTIVVNGLVVTGNSAGTMKRVLTSVVYENVRSVSATPLTLLPVRV